MSGFKLRDRTGCTSSDFHLSYRFGDIFKKWAVFDFRVELFRLRVPQAFGSVASAFVSMLPSQCPHVTLWRPQTVTNLWALPVFSSALVAGALVRGPLYFVCKMTLSAAAPMCVSYCVGDAMVWGCEQPILQDPVPCC